MALIRHESGFNPKAVSSARAAGLLQLMPGTARFAARQLLGERRKRLKLRHLFQPDRNLRIGARYFRYILDRVDGNVALAIAGYNAGPGAIRTWRNRWGHLDTDEFVEELPYREARGYTKQVLQAWGAYRYLYAAPGDADAGRVPVPERVRPVQDVALATPDLP